MALIDKPLFNSRITSENITNKEKWLGYFENFVKKIKENITVPVNFSLQSNGLLIDGKFARFF